MSEHSGFLCSRESFMIDAPTVKAGCPICLRESRIKLGWVVCQCEKCGNYFSDDNPSGIMKARREYIGWSLEAMACVSELKVATIKQYEKKWPSKKYYELTAELVREYNEQQIIRE